MYETIANLNPYQLYTLASHHVYVYEKRYEAATKDTSLPIRIDECRAYLDIWIGVRNVALKAFESNAKTMRGFDLDDDQEDEILDAIASGDFDDILTEHQER